METVGFIGLGNMGGAVAANIGAAGYPLIVNDIHEEATRPLLESGARFGATPAEVAEASDVVVTSLPSPKEVELVALGSGGLMAGIGSGKVYVDLSSSHPNTIRKIGAAFRVKGTEVLDAPLIVGKEGIRERSVQVLASGDRAAYDRVKPVLDAFSDTVVYTGELGTGTYIKLAHNLVRRGIGLAIGEGLVLGAKAGVDPSTLWECMYWGLDTQMHQLRESFAKAVSEPLPDAPATFTLALSRKDVGLAMDVAREFDVPMPIAALVEQYMVEGMVRGWSQQSTAALLKLQEEAAGIDFSGRSEEAQSTG